MNYYQSEVLRAKEKRLRAQKRLHVSVKPTFDSTFDLILATANNSATDLDLYEHFGKSQELPVEFCIRHSIPF